MMCVGYEVNDTNTLRTSSSHVRRRTYVCTETGVASRVRLDGDGAPARVVSARDPRRVSKKAPVGSRPFAPPPARTRASSSRMRSSSSGRSVSCTNGADASTATGGARTLRRHDSRRRKADVAEAPRRVHVVASSRRAFSAAAVRASSIRPGARLPVGPADRVAPGCVLRVLRPEPDEVDSSSGRGAEERHAIRLRRRRRARQSTDAVRFGSRIRRHDIERPCTRRTRVPPPRVPGPARASSRATASRPRRSRARRPRARPRKPRANPRAPRRAPRRRGAPGAESSNTARERVWVPGDGAVVPSVFLFPHDESFVVSRAIASGAPEKNEKKKNRRPPRRPPGVRDGRRSQLLRRPNRDQADAGRGRASRVSGGLS